MIMAQGIASCIVKCCYCVKSIIGTSKSTSPTFRFPKFRGLPFCQSPSLALSGPSVRLFPRPLTISRRPFCSRCSRNYSISPAPPKPNSELDVI